MPKEVAISPNINRMPVNHALQHVIWKPPVVEGEKVDNDYYSGQGDHQPDLRGGSISGTVKDSILGHDIISIHHTNIQTLAHSLNGISNFSPYAYTRVKDSLGSIIYENLAYNNLYDFCDAMINDPSFSSMHYVEHYITIDNSIKTPRVKGRNLAYWHIVGKSMYNKKIPGTIFSRIQDPKSGIKKIPKFPVSKKAILDNIAQFISNQDRLIQDNGGFSGYDLGTMLRNSSKENLHSWPHLHLHDVQEFLNPYNQYSQTIGIYDTRNGKVDTPANYLTNWGPDQNANLYCTKVWIINLVFNYDFSSVDTRGYCCYANNHVPERNYDEIPFKTDVMSGLLEYPSQMLAQSSKMIEARESQQNTKFRSSTIALFEWSSTQDFYRSYSIKPVSDDIFTMDDTSEALHKDNVFLLIEETNKKTRIEKYDISREIWPDVYNTGSSQDEINRGYIGSFYLQDFEDKFSRRSSRKYFNRGKNLLNEDIKISIMLADVNHPDGGYFFEPSNSKIILNKNKKRITEIIAKT